MSQTYQEVFKFWLGDDFACFNEETYMHKPQLWFKLNKNTDEQITELFGTLLKQAESNRLSDEWTSEYRARVALVIVFDQFSRNIYRGTSGMFKNDHAALSLALELISDKTLFEKLSSIERYFVYLPLLHSEDLGLAKQSLDAFEQLANEATTLQKSNYLKYLQSARVHYDLFHRRRFAWNYLFCST